LPANAIFLRVRPTGFINTRSPADILSLTFFAGGCLAVRASRTVRVSGKEGLALYYVFYLANI
jgi:hypothetical protein